MTYNYWLLICCADFISEFYVELPKSKKKCFAILKQIDCPAKQMFTRDANQNQSTKNLLRLFWAIWCFKMRVDGT